MEQFVLVSASVYNRSLNTQSVTKQELPKYQPSQNPRYQTDSLKKEMNKKLLAEAGSSIDKSLSCPRIKLSNSKALILDGMKTGLLLSHFGQQLRRTNAEKSDLYFVLLNSAGVSPPLVLNHNAKGKERRRRFLFKI